MTDKIKELMIKYREIIIYLIVGVMTTIVSWVSCFVGERFIFDVNSDWQNAVNNTISWVISVCFAYPQMPPVGIEVATRGFSVPCSTN